MARLLTAILLAGLAWLAGAARAGEAPSTTVLRDTQGMLQAEPLARFWVDEGGEATLAQAQRAASAFQPATAGTVYQLAHGGALWLHLRLQRGAHERQDWLLKFPMPVLDLVTEYQREGEEWRADSAGDTLAVARWPERGRYPVFRLDLPAGEERDVFVRIRHATRSGFPMELSTDAHHSDRLQVEYLGLGAAFGALLLLIAGCLAKSWAYRDPTFAWYAGYALLTCLAVASFTGIAPQLLWPNFGLLEDAPTPVLGCAAVAAAVLFVRTTLGLRRRLVTLDKLTLVLGIAGLVLAPLPMLAPKPLHLPLVGGYICLASVVVLLVAIAAWWRGDTVARWVFAAQLPMVVAVLVTVARSLGWAELPTVSQNLVVGALAVEVPLLLVALFIRSRDRHGAEVREQALSTHDALTGLLAPHLFQDRLRHVVTRFQRERQSAAIMYIDLVNYGRIREYFGSAVAEQSLLRSVIKLRRLLRDVDTVSRVGEARFAVILEGATSRASVSERATRLIASGLTPLQGLKPDVTLQFHVAALLLNERPMEAEQVEQALDAKLARMSPRTRRPIRFVEAETSVHSDPGDSSLFAEDLPVPATDLAPAP
jgi:diguanylate cyclase (GGDEF)-like protein